jgi:Spy/CpxP family protein refolding chaperone
MNKGKTMKRKLTITLVSIFAMGAIAAATPINYKDCPRKDIMYHTALFEKLNLSKSQKHEIDSIKKSNFEKRQAMMRQNSVFFSNYLSDRGFDKSKYIKDKSDREQMMADNFEKIYSILTPSQKKEFIELLKQMESKRMDMMKDPRWRFNGQAN